MRELVVVDGVKYEFFFWNDDNSFINVLIKLYGKDEGRQFPFELTEVLCKGSPTKYQCVKRDIKETIKGFAHSKEARKILYRKTVKCLVQYLKSKSNKK